MRQSICSAANRRSSETWKTSRSRRQAGRVRAQARPSFALLDRAFQGLGRNAKEGPFESVGSTAFARTSRLARAPGAASAAPAPVGARSARPFDPSATGARPFVLLSFRPVVVRPRMGGGGLPRRTAKDDGTTGRQDRPRPPSGRGGRFLVVSSARRLVVLAKRRNSPRAEFAKCSFQVGGCEFNGHTAQSKEINHV